MLIINALFSHYLVLANRAISLQDLVTMRGQKTAINLQLFLFKELVERALKRQLDHGTHWWRVEGSVCERALK